MKFLYLGHKILQENLFHGTRINKAIFQIADKLFCRNLRHSSASGGCSRMELQNDC